MSGKGIDDSVSWRAPAFNYKKKSIIWYGQISIFFFLVILSLFLLKNYLGIAIITLLFWYFLSRADEKPETINYKIDQFGVTIGNQRFSYPDIHSFTYDESSHDTVLVLDLATPFTMPVYVIVKKVEIDKVMDVLTRHIPRRNDFSVIRWITHRLHY